MSRQRQRDRAARGLVSVVMALLIALVVVAPAATQTQEEESLTIALNEFEGSGVSGSATLTPLDGGVSVAMAVEGEEISGDHPTHIHTGTCDDFDPNPTYPLTTVILDPLSNDGVSETAVEEVTLGELLDGDHVILVHKSTEELTTYFVCGDIARSNAIADPGDAGAMTAPVIGVGTAFDRGSNALPALAALGALILALAAVALLWNGYRTPN